MRTKITVSVFAVGLLASWILAFGSPAAQSRKKHEPATHEATDAARPLRSEQPAAVPPVEAPLPAVATRLAPVQTSPRREEPEQAPEDLSAREHRQRRQLYADQPPDAAWTERMQRDLAERAKAILSGNLRVDDLSCHQSVCRMYFELEREADIDIFIPSAFEPDHQYSYRSIDEDESEEQSTFMYEVLVTRPWPGHRPPQTPERIEPITNTATAASNSGS